MTYENITFKSSWIKFSSDDWDSCCPSHKVFNRHDFPLWPCLEQKIDPTFHICSVNSLIYNLSSYLRYANKTYIQQLVWAEIVSFKLKYLCVTMLYVPSLGKMSDP